MQLNFNASQVAPNTTPEPVDTAWYPVVITGAEEKPNSKSTGSFLELSYTIQQGQYANRVLKGRLNLKNPNQQAVEIAQGELSAICHVTGRMQLQHAQQLLGAALQVYAVKAPRNDRPGQFSNDIQGYRDMNGNEPGQGAQNGGFAGGGQQQMGGNPQGQNMGGGNPQGGNPQGGWQGQNGGGYDPNAQQGGNGGGYQQQGQGGNGQNYQQQGNNGGGNFDPNANQQGGNWQGNNQQGGGYQQQNPQGGNPQGGNPQGQNNFQQNGNGGGNQQGAGGPAGGGNMPSWA